MKHVRIIFAYVKIRIAILCIFFPLCSEQIQITFSNDGIPILDGQALTGTDLYHLKNNPARLIKNLQKKLQTHSFATSQEKNDCKKTLDRLMFLNETIAPYLFWWQTHPMIGMRLESPFWPLRYPYMPHAFALWELAPSLGKGIDVFLVDTGIAAFTIDIKGFYKKHQDLQMLADFSRNSYNFTWHEEDILDPFEQLIEMLIKYTDTSYDNDEYIRNHLPDWIRNYLHDGTTRDIKTYLCTYGKSSLWEKSGSQRHLTEEGKRALREIIQGELGFKPKHLLQRKNYTLVDLKDPNNQKEIIMEFLPSAPIFTQNVDTINNDRKENEFFAASYESGHGSHSAGIIGALLHSYEDQANLVTKAHIKEWLYRDSGICGLAPRCHTVMIKGLRSDGFVNNRKIVIKSVRQAHRLGAKILNLSLKLDDQLDITEPDIVALQKTLAKIPYVVACSGNASTDKHGHIKASIESYPAKFESVPFDVGSFSWQQDKHGNYHCPILETSQYQKNIGPKFVMPGQNILSCGLVPQQTENSMYVFMQGTSTSAPLISGFLALVVAEFSGVFLPKYERSIILKSCYSSAFKMHASEDWNSRCLLGVLDMRTALLVLHCMKSLKESLEKHPAIKKNYPFYKNIDYYMTAIHMVLMHDITEYMKTKNQSCDFKNDYMQFFNLIKNNDPDPQLNELRFSKINIAIEYVVKTILDGLYQHKKSHSLENSIAKLFEKKECNVLDGYSRAIQARIAQVF